MNLKLRHITTVLMLTSLGFSAQENNITWQENLGGKDIDMAYDLIETPNEGLITVGYSYSSDGMVSGNYGWQDGWIVKTDSRGFLEWDINFGGSGADVFQSVCLDGENFVVVGWSTSSDGLVTSNKGVEDGLIAKFTLNGDLVWSKTIGGTSVDKILRIIPTNDDGYAAIGYTHSNDFDVSRNHGLLDYWLIKFDANGNILWERTYGGSDDDFANDLIQTTDGGYALLGSSNSIDGDVAGNYGEWDVWVLKTNSIGDVEWERNFGGSGNDEGKSLVETNSGNLVVTGSTFSNTAGKSDAFVSILNPYGVTLSYQTIGGDENDGFNRIAKLSNGQYMLSGFTYSDRNLPATNFQGAGDGWLVLMNADGSISWEQTLGGSDTDMIHAAILKKSGSLATAGYSRSQDGDLENNQGDWDFWLVEMNGQINLSEGLDVTVYPNPAVSEIKYMGPQWENISYAIMNMTGQVVAQNNANNLNRSISIDHLAPGMYTLVLQSDEQISTGTFIKQ